MSEWFEVQVYHAFVPGLVPIMVLFLVLDPLVRVGGQVLDFSHDGESCVTEKGEQLEIRTCDVPALTLCAVPEALHLDSAGTAALLVFLG